MELRRVIEVNPHLAEFGTVNEFMEKNKNLVHHVAKKFYNLTKMIEADEDDLFAEGMIGMLKAYMKYDPTKFTGVSKFSTYAVPKIEGEIRRLLRDQGEVGVKFSRGIKDLYYHALREGIEKESPEYIALKLETTVANAKDMKIFAMNKYSNMARISEPIFETDGEPLTLADKIKSSGSEPDGNISVYDALRRLTENQRNALVLYSEGHSQIRIGARMGLSQVQVSRLVKAAKEKIKEYLEVPDVGEEREMARGRGNAVGDINEAIRLISSTDKKYREIAEQTGCNYATVAFHGRNIRGQKKRHHMNGPVVTRKLTKEEKEAYTPTPTAKKEEKVFTRELPVVQFKAPEEASPEIVVEHIKQSMANMNKEESIHVLTVEPIAQSEPERKETLIIPIQKPLQSNVSMSFDKNGLSMNEMRQELENILSAMELMGLEDLNFSLNIASGKPEPVAV